MIGRGDQDRVDVAAIEELAEIAIGLAVLAPVPLVDLALLAVTHVLAHVADGRDLHVSAAQERAHVAAAPAPQTDRAHDDPFAGRRAPVAPQGRRGEHVGCRDGHTGSREKLTSRRTKALLCHRLSFAAGVHGMRPDRFREAETSPAPRGSFDLEFPDGPPSPPAVQSEPAESRPRHEAPRTPTLCRRRAKKVTRESSGDLRPAHPGGARLSVDRRGVVRVAKSRSPSLLRVLSGGELERRVSGDLRPGGESRRKRVPPRPAEATMQ